MISLFLFDPLAKIMLALISVIGTFVTIFSYRYMSVDYGYGRFFITLFLLIGSLSSLVCTHYIPLFFLLWISSNVLLVQLMRHNVFWSAAYESSLLAQKYFMAGFICMGIAFSLLMYQSGTCYMYELVATQSWVTVIALFLLLITALIQSAVYPFNRWLLSSLNSPTPVSAFMHAGLVNGGGFLIVRFAHLYSKFPVIMACMVIVGTISALIGVFYKLVQTDVKRMLACSTVAQMGFVFVQCGFGLFSAAVAHLCWHGVFKAYLFLSSSTIEYRSSSDDRSVTIRSFLMAVIIGLFGTYLFIIGHQVSEYNSTELLLIVVAFVVSVQMALALLPIKKWIDVVYALMGSCVVAWMYAKIDISLEYILPDYLYSPQPLQLMYGIGLLLLLISWIIMVFGKRLFKIFVFHTLFVRLYVWAVQTSLPAQQTMTLYRNKYRYK